MIEIYYSRIQDINYVEIIKKTNKNSKYRYIICKDIKGHENKYIVSKFIEVAIPTLFLYAKKNNIETGKQIFNQ